MIEYPELEKMKKVQAESQSIGGFLDWLTGEKEITLAKWKDNAEFAMNDRLMPIHLNIEQLLAEYFHIDLNKVEKERQ